MKHYYKNRFCNVCKNEKRIASLKSLQFEKHFLKIFSEPTKIIFLKQRQNLFSENLFLYCSCFMKNNSSFRLRHLFPIAQRLPCRAFPHCAGSSRQLEIDF